LRLVRTPFVVITDDDCLPDAGWIEGYAAHCGRPHTVFTGAVGRRRRGARAEYRV
jgi:hypothetical protein